MIDFAKITVRAGSGGRGAGSFTKVKNRKKHGKADGGDGGDGGDVYIEASADLSTLEPFRFVKDYKAGDGQQGASNLRKGARGAELTLMVPVGTVVKLEGADLAYDLVEAQEKVLIAKGGEAGRGNSHLKDELGRRPYKGEKGEDGEFRELTLELKIIADIGLIGLPNAGKSTLLSKITSAKPQIANYPFTTLEPNLGVMMKKKGSKRERLVLADIPGLIEGASSGKGLGDLFLRHIERTKMLLHLIDVSVYGGDSFDDVWSNYQTIRSELKTYSKELVRKKEMIVLTKVDLCGNEIALRIAKEFGKKKKKVVLISAESGEGLEELKKEMFKLSRD